MPSSGGFPLPCSSKSLLTTITSSASPSLSFPSKTHLNHVHPTPPNPPFSHSSPQFFHAHLAFSSIHAPRRRNGLRLYASKKQKQGKRGVPPLLEMDGLDDEEFGYDDDEDGDENGDEDGGFFLPFDKMSKWLENKPRGFGEGKVYDTSIEDQLLEEMQESRLAQAANLGKLEKESSKTVPKQDDQKEKGNEVVPNGVGVRVVNLPKKKNVHRDLSVAFKGLPGLICINPVVSGNKKTRDPICKGFAFVYFKSEEHATRFTQMFSRQTITFGKIQKQIKCEMMHSRPSDSALEQPSADSNTDDSPQLEVHGLSLREDQSVDCETNDSSLDQLENSASVEYENDDPDDELYMAEWEDISENLDAIAVSELSDSNGYEHIKESELKGDSLPSYVERIEALENRLLAKGKEEKFPGRMPSLKDKKGVKVAKKKPAVKGKEGKVPKLGIPGSAKRLKVKEKAVLTDVFSKYGLNSAVER